MPCGLHDGSLSRGIAMLAAGCFGAHVGHEQGDRVTASPEPVDE
jgi:hypothetical protein